MFILQFLAGDLIRMTVSNEGRRRKRRKNRWDSTARINAVFPLVFLLILALQVSLSCGEEINNIGGSSNSIRWSPARKSRFFESWPYRYSRASQMVNSSENSSHNLYEEEKRLVHTGPNPLHN